MVLPYDYYYYVKTTYFRHLEFKIGSDLCLNLNLAKFLCIITKYHMIKHFELLLHCETNQRFNSYLCGSRVF